jgi:hypothetical protein
VLGLRNALEIARAADEVDADDKALWSELDNVDGEDVEGGGGAGEAAAEEAADNVDVTIVAEATEDDDDDAKDEDTTAEPAATEELACVPADAPLTEGELLLLVEEVRGGAQERVGEEGEGADGAVDTGADKHIAVLEPV